MSHPAAQHNLKRRSAKHRHRTVKSQAIGIYRFQQERPKRRPLGNTHHQRATTTEASRCLVDVDSITDVLICVNEQVGLLPQQAIRESRRIGDLPLPTPDASQCQSVTIVQLLLFEAPSFKKVKQSLVVGHEDLGGLSRERPALGIGTNPPDQLIGPGLRSSKDFSESFLLYT